MSPGTGIVALGRRDRPAFVSLMAGAFARDPMFLHLYPGKLADREQAMRPFMSFMFDATGLRGDLRLGLFRDGVLVACALVDRPPAGRVRALMGMVLTLVRALPMLARLSRDRIRFLNRYMAETREMAPKSPHHYLTMIGVSPGFQGQGLGRRLIDRIVGVAERDRSSAGIALDTENEANIALYRRIGFRSRGRVAIGAVIADCMFRPRGEAA